MAVSQVALIPRWLFGSILATLALQGCAIGGYGTLVGRHTHTATAVVIDIYSVGLHLRTFRPDAGVSAGFRHASYVFPKLADDSHPPGTAWHWFAVRLPDRVPLLSASTAVGLETHVTPYVQRVALGYVDQVLTLGPTAGESRIVEIRYDRRNPKLTHVHDEETNR